MTEDEFREKFNIRMCGKCCATCKHGCDLCDDGAYECVHPALEGDSIIVSSESVCDAWDTTTSGISKNGAREVSDRVNVSAAEKGDRMITVDEFWAKCNETCNELMRKGHTPAALFTQNCAIVYTAMKCMKNGRRGNESIDDDDGNIGVCRAKLGKPADNGRGRIRMRKPGEGVQKAPRGEAEVGQGQEGGEEGKKDEQEVSDLCHMRKIERGRVLYCLDYIMRSLNDEEAQAIWLDKGCEDGLMTDRNFLTEDQVEDHAELVASQAQLDYFVALAARTLFSEVYPDAWAFLKDQFKHKFDELMRPERCVLS